MYESIVANSGADNSTYSKFPDPFMDMASTVMPKDIKTAFRLCQFIVSVNPTYAEALRRIASYFITDVVVASPNTAKDGTDAITAEERAKYIEFFDQKLGIRTILLEAALDYMVYGNSWISVLLPFRRHLMCQKCTRNVPLRKAYEDPKIQLKWKDFRWHMKCPRCGHVGPAMHIDRRSGEPERIIIKRWSPLDIDLIHNKITGRSDHILRLASDVRADITAGELTHLEDVPWELIKAVEEDKHFKFEKESIFHMREATLAGIMHGGYGISRVLTNFKQAWYCQILGRYNETIAMDYMIPWRVMSPASRGGAMEESSDPLVSINMADFVSQGHKMVRAHRKDPASVHFFPYPIEYQTLGGEAKQMAPSELINQGLKTLLDGIGIPQELYSGTLTAQTAPASLRLFEALNGHLVHQLNRLLQFIVDQVSKVLNWEPVVCTLKPVTHADDLNRQMAKLQLMQAGLISNTTGLQSVGIVKNEEDRLKIEEQKQEAKLQEQAKKELQQQDIMSQMSMPPQPPPEQQPITGTGSLMPPANPNAPQGAAPAFAANTQLIPNAPVTLEELQGIAQTLAQQAMTMPSRGQRVSFMIQLRKENPTVHALVKSQLDDIDRQASLQGRDLVLQQQYGQA